MLPVIALISTLLTWPFGQPQSVVRMTHLGAWRMSVRTDRFTGAVSCRLFKGSAFEPGVAYAHASLAFRFSPRLSTLDAVYRVDQGPARLWTSIYPSLVQLRAMPPAASLENPTGGLVVLPMTELTAARTVTIRPSPDSQPKIFQVARIADALAQARALGCSSDDDFVR